MKRTGRRLERRPEWLGAVRGRVWWARESVWRWRRCRLGRGWGSGRGIGATRSQAAVTDLRLVAVLQLALAAVGWADPRRAGFPRFDTSGRVVTSTAVALYIYSGQLNFARRRSTCVVAHRALCQSGCDRVRDTHTVRQYGLHGTLYSRYAYGDPARWARRGVTPRGRSALVSGWIDHKPRPRQKVIRGVVYGFSN